MTKFGDDPDLTWIKSSRSQGGGECVEVATDGVSVGIRDSKDSALTPIVISRDAFSALLDSL